MLLTEVQDGVNGLGPIHIGIIGIILGLDRDNGKRKWKLLHYNRVCINIYIYMYIYIGVI